MTNDATQTTAEHSSEQAPAGSARRKRQGEKARALLAQLAEWHPQLFGEAPAPLKRGIFQDLAAAHPDVPHTALRAALRLHTSSTRYLKTLADGGTRLGLDGQESEQVAPEHIWQALAALFARRCRRADANLDEQRRWLPW
ncbi:MAG: ProQ/FinO family protein, partial [Ottowia sp.]|nr:ProQ/FinO family protein [Ottowia sp.]